MKWNFMTHTLMIDQGKTALQNLAELARIRAEVVIRPEFLPGAIEGVRTNDMTFTPTVNPAWTINEHVGKRMVVFVDTDPSIFSVHKVASNTGTAVVITPMYGDATLLIGCTRLYLFTSWEIAMDYVKYIQR